ncbi:hypothetical protein Hypma_003407 [Hypsizygus marmoreus]|uniref:Uncharacterized protein n=1 Tax=Hypsizygus marmoreus TaxID=39966 RepID=A0A369J272_HYPMA|nr:hypothetical protein Hypma_003407 [Hypsizygus marmoreus]
MVDGERRVEPCEFETTERRDGHVIVASGPAVRDPRFLPPLFHFDRLFPAHLPRNLCSSSSCHVQQPQDNARVSARVRPTPSNCDPPQHFMGTTRRTLLPTPIALDPQDLCSSRARIPEASTDPSSSRVRSHLRHRPSLHLPTCSSPNHDASASPTPNPHSIPAYTKQHTTPHKRHTLDRVFSPHLHPVPTRSVAHRYPTHTQDYERTRANNNHDTFRWKPARKSGEDGEVRSDMAPNTTHDPVRSW